MKNINKQKGAEYLLGELGNIDDRFIAEAENYRPARPAVRRFVIMAAAAAAVFVLMLAMIPVLMMGRDKNGEANVTSYIYDSGTAIETEYSIAYPPTTLDELLEKSQDTVDYVTEDEDEINLFDGEAKLIWQYDGDRDYCIVPISTVDCGILLNQVGDGKDVGETSPEAGCRFWIAPGDGTVLTPYLKDSGGNVGYGELFGYAAEIEPDTRFVYNVLWLISN